MHFRCNLKCLHCMIEGTMDRLTPESDDRFREVLEFNRTHRRWSGLILTGSEITLRRDLPELAGRARANGFDHVRIQSHGMRLADIEYCRELIEAGVDEFFISICAADAETHDAVTKVPGSFEKTLRGLINLDAFPHVCTLTNTVITSRSWDRLPAIVDLLADLERLVQMDFWSYWPMAESDHKDLLVPHAVVAPRLREAIRRARRFGRTVEVKNFPHCLLGTEADALRNDQPRLIVDPRFWDEFARNGFHECVHRESCRSTQCLGLNAGYVAKYGWDADLLQPLGEVDPVTNELVVLGEVGR
ncbi:MAG: radical SAM protein [Isosphaeraceae bacterium]|nr:radical SAM protein [Isosphaeraceae bacterium]